MRDQELGHAAADWDRLSGWYIADVRTGSERHRIAREMVVSLARDVVADHILDIGCGEGHVARALAKAGASVIGIDHSTELLAAARSYEPAERRATFQLAEAEVLSHIADATFDGVVACLCLDGIADLRSAVVALSRAARTSAWLVIVVPHPCFEAPRSEWLTAVTPIRTIPDGYLDARSRNFADGVGGAGEIASYHRPLSMYFGELGAHGWACTDLVEPAAEPGLPPRTPTLLGLRFERAG